VRFDEILAYYRLADVFLCMSEHEGFCVPLVEAMYFDVPILALAAAAVPNTLGGSGLLVDTPEPALIAELIDGLMKDEALRKDVLESQRARLSDFSYEKTGKRFEELMRAYL
jgi:glycosyltransferase involved in cell wall biosynthesis